MAYTILLIESNVGIAAGISNVLELAHYKVIQASNGEAGVSLAHEIRPDLILCDTFVPELNGYAIFHILSSDLETTAIPFVFLTGKSDFRTVMNLGADDYIAKPPDGVNLLRTG